MEAMTEISPYRQVVVNQADRPATVVNLSPAQTTVKVVIPGPPGPRGVPGPAGDGGDLSYVHDQGTPASVWEIPHEFGRAPGFTVVGSDGSIEHPYPEYVTPYLLRLAFGAAVSGKANLY